MTIEEYFNSHPQLLLELDNFILYGKGEAVKMTYERAHAKLNDLKFYVDDPELKDAFEMACKALKMQVPVKPKYQIIDIVEYFDGTSREYSKSHPHCPACGENLMYLKSESHCYCGQAIDWNDDLVSIEESLKSVVKGESK